MWPGVPEARASSNLPGDVHSLDLGRQTGPGSRERPLAPSAPRCAKGRDSAPLRALPAPEFPGETPIWEKLLDPMLDRS